MLNALRSFACWHHCFSVHLLKRGVYDFAPWCRSGGLSVGRSVYQPFFPITWKHMYTYSDLSKWHLLVFMSMVYMLRSQWPFMPKWILTNNVTRHKILDLKTCALVWNTAWHLLIFCVTRFYVKATAPCTCMQNCFQITQNHAILTGPDVRAPIKLPPQTFVHLLFDHPGCSFTK